MSNGKEYETYGIINFFGVALGVEDFEGIFENAKKRYPVRLIDYDSILSLPFTFSETENGIVVFLKNEKLAIARPVVAVHESTNDEFEVVYLTENEFNEVF